MVFGFSGSKAIACWSGWIESPILPLLVRLRHVHVEPERSPRWVSMAPQYTCVSRSGATARNQSYQACPVAPPGGGATAVHVPPARRQRYAVPPLAPQAYTTAGLEGAISTASRVNAVGAPGSVTAGQVLPWSVDLRTPSLEAAKTFPFGATESDHVRC